MLVLNSNILSNTTNGLLSSILQTLDREGSTKPIVMSNRSSTPYTVTSLATHVRWSRVKARIANNANYSSCRLYYTNWGANSSNEFSGESSITVDAAIEYQGIIYRGYYNGNTTLTLASGDSGYLEIPNLTLPAGSDIFVITKYVGQAGTANRIQGHGASGFIGEGSIASSTDSVDYFNTVYQGSGCTYTVNISGGTITSITKLTGGSNYSASGSAANVYASEVQANGTIAQKVVGYISATAGVVTSFTMTSGAPPAGATWSNPTLSFGNLFQSDNLVYGPAIIVGTPDRPANALMIAGDSIARGYSSADSVGDLKRNFGIIERSLRNVCGVANASMTGITANSYRNLAVYPKTMAFFAPFATHALIELGTNDISLGSTKTQVQSYLTSIANTLKTYGLAVSFTTLLPKTTSTDSWVTTANQTETTGFTSGGTKDLHNADVRSGAFTSEWGYIEMETVFRDSTTPTKWRVDLGGAATNDGIHPNLLAIAYSETNGPSFSALA